MYRKVFLCDDDDGRVGVRGDCSTGSGRAEDAYLVLRTVARICIGEVRVDIPFSGFLVLFTKMFTKKRSISFLPRRCISRALWHSR